MNTSTIKALDSTLQKTHTWLRELATEMGWQDELKAYHGLRVVLHALRDRLTIEEATDFAAQLPMLIRGCYYEGWQPKHTPTKEHSKTQFLARVEHYYDGDPNVDPEQLARAVFRVIAKHVSAGEIEDIRRCLPQRVRSLWDED